jgi:hypothetical protein
MAMFPHPMSKPTPEMLMLLVRDDSSHRLRVAEMTVSADDAGDDITNQHAIAHLRDCRVVVLTEDLEGTVLELRNLRFFRRDRTRCVSCLPRPMLFACCLAERTPNGHRPLTWPLDSAVGVEAGFAGQFPSASLVWIMPGHVGLSIPTQVWTMGRC